MVFYHLLPGILPRFTSHSVEATFFLPAMVYVTCHLHLSPCSCRSPLVKINSQTVQTVPDMRKVDQDYADGHKSARTSHTHIGYQGTLVNQWLVYTSSVLYKRTTLTELTNLAYTS